ncbi:hypothetical protein [Salipiger marinus]|uniref:hypothetical protein n=1 Tax=Salipiger marinus TaxID=555512 RepID=UPI00405969E9
MRVLAVFLILCVSACATLQPQPARDPVVDHRQLLVLTTDRPDTVTDAARRLGYGFTREDRLGALGEALIHLRLPANRRIPDAIAEIETGVPGVTAGANHADRLQAASARGPGSGYANAPIGWPEGGCRALQSIGLIDAGLRRGFAAPASARIVQATLHSGPAAPGVDLILSVGGQPRVVSGTSAAAFVTSGTAADPGLRRSGHVAQVRTRLSQRARDLGATGKDETFGAGLIVSPQGCLRR